MRTTLIIIILIGFFQLRGQVQSPLPKNIMGIQTGYAHFRYHDEIESNSTYAGNFLPLNFRWLTFREKSIDEFWFSFGELSLTSTEDQIFSNTSFKATNLFWGYAYHFKLKDAEKINLYAGPKVFGWYSNRNLLFDLSDEYQNKDFFGALSASLVGTYQWEKNIFFINIDYGLVSFLAQRKYSLYDDTQTDLIATPRFTSFQMNSMFVHQMSSNWSWSLGYQLYYYRYPRHEDIKVMKGLQSQLIAGIHINF